MHFIFIFNVFCIIQLELQYNLRLKVLFPGRATGTVNTRDCTWQMGQLKEWVGFLSQQKPGTAFRSTQCRRRYLTTFTAHHKKKVLVQGRNIIQIHVCHRNICCTKPSVGEYNLQLSVFFKNQDQDVEKFYEILSLIHCNRYTAHI